MPASLDGLNRPQRAAVTHPGRAAARARRARAPARRARSTRALRLARGAGRARRRRLALTFSPAAAAEMRERLEALIDPPYEELHVLTFRAFCARLLRDEALEAGLDPFFAPVTAADRVALLLDRLDELTLRHHEIRGNPAPLLAGFVSRIDRLKDEMISAADSARYAERRSRAGPATTPSARTPRASSSSPRLYADHDRLLAERGALDFGDLVAARRSGCCTRSRTCASALAERFRHVLVDEYQDANFAQGMLLRPARARSTAT